MNVKTQLEFELTYNNVTIEHVSYSAMGNSPLESIWKRIKLWHWTQRFCFSMKVHWKLNLLLKLAYLAGVVEYTDFISAEW